MCVCMCLVCVCLCVCACVQAVEPPPDPIRQTSLWVECGGDSGLLVGVFESEPLFPVYTSSPDTSPPGEVEEEEEEEQEEEKEEEDAAACLVGSVCLNEAIEGLITDVVRWNIFSKVCRRSGSLT